MTRFHADRPSRSASVAASLPAACASATATPRRARVAGLVWAALLAGCAAPMVNGPGGEPGKPWPGTVQSIQEGQSTGGWQGITGSLTGSVLGAVLGSGIGGGLGTTIATVITSSAGAVAGQQVGTALGAKPVWRVVVRGEDGIDRTVSVGERPTYRPGSAVTVDPKGAVAPR